MVLSGGERLWGVSPVAVGRSAANSTRQGSMHAKALIARAGATLRSQPKIFAQARRLTVPKEPLPRVWRRPPFLVQKVISSTAISGCVSRSMWSPDAPRTCGSVPSQQERNSDADGFLTWRFPHLTGLVERQAAPLRHIGQVCACWQLTLCCSGHCQVYCVQTKHHVCSLSNKVSPAVGDMCASGACCDCLATPYW